MKKAFDVAPAEIGYLQEFVSHVNELIKSRFAQRVLAQPTIRLRTKSDWTNAELVNFDEEECQSFLLKCRLLIQDRDGISINRIWSMFKDRIDDSWWAKINPPRWMLNDYLDAQALFEGGSNASVNNRLILETFLYGSYAHLNPEYRKRFKEWQTDPERFYLLKLEFIMALKVLLSSAAKMTLVVEEFLKQLTER